MSAAGAIQMQYITVDDPCQLYHNVVVVLDRAADINNGQPGSLARWIDAMELKPGERAFHLGCGVGYYTAIMAELVGSQGSVVGAELNNSLAERARENLSSYRNVAVHAGDGAEFDPGECDAMLINAGMTHPLLRWLERLRDGGRLIIPLTMATSATLGAGVMARITRTRTTYSAQVITPVAIYSCATARDSNLEPVLRKAATTGSLMKMKCIRFDSHEPDETCVIHADRLCVSSV
jgi:protein-L-isoaspartate(D-aspartate) O-methyltransferase